MSPKLVCYFLALFCFIIASLPLSGKVLDFQNLGFAFLTLSLIFG